MVVIASNIGAAEYPRWNRNLVADPGVTVEVGDAGTTREIPVVRLDPVQDASGC